MVEAAKEGDASQAPPKAQPKEVGKCEHHNELRTYCNNHDMALCNDCYFDKHNGCGRGMTLKQASAVQIE